MKAQGLPINFVVIAALAILILILAAGFVIAGGTSVGAAMGPQQSRNTCSGFCTTMQNTAMGVYNPIDYNWTGSKWCDSSFDVQGVGTGKKCYELTQCMVTYGDGTTEMISAGKC